MEDNLKSKIQSNSDEELLRIIQMSNEYTPDAVKYTKEELDLRGITYNSNLIEENEVLPTEKEDGLLRENWLVILILILIPFGVLLVGDTEIAQRAGRKIVPAIACLAAYALFTQWMFKFPSEKRFTHYSIIYFIIWIVLLITSS